MLKRPSLTIFEDRLSKSSEVSQAAKNWFQNIKRNYRQRDQFRQFGRQLKNEEELRAAKPISVAVIAQNCQSQLADLVESVAVFAKEVVVVDGGSTDGSIQYCQDHPLIKLIQRPWDDNFAAQKNCAIEACQSEWILHLDSDERVGENFVKYWPWLVSDRDQIGYRIPMYWLSPDSSEHYIDSKKHYPSYCPRFFRRDANFRYHQQNPVHVTFDKDKIKAMRKLYGIHLFHYCFQWLSREQLEAKANKYDDHHPGAEQTTDQYYRYWKHPYTIKRTTEKIVRSTDHS